MEGRGNDLVSPHFFPKRYNSKSTIRLEKPHSLSYQEIIFAIFPPITFVDRPSTIEEWGFPLKSMETRGSSQKIRIPFHFPSAYDFKTLFTCSAVISFFNNTTKSTTETFGVGTRIAIPSIFPFNSGITKERAVAAPVVVGIIDIPAALARRRSRCGKSRIT